MQESHPVIEALRKTLVASRSSTTFVNEMGERIHQLVVDMVDGQVLPKRAADALRMSIVDFVRSEALVKFAGQSPSDALAILDKLKAYGYTQLEGERPQLNAALAARFPPPPPAIWPELVELRAAAGQHPDACKIGLPVQSIYFAKQLEEEGLHLPEELLTLYAWCESFDLSCIGATYLPVFSLSPPLSLDVSEAEDGYPRRQAVFQGGDEVQFSVYRDRKGQWWLVYELEYQPIGKKPLDLRELIQFGLRRMNAPTADALLGAELSWERFFDIKDR
jgi:hypothetical protein